MGFNMKESFFAKLISALNPYNRTSGLGYKVVWVLPIIYMIAIFFVSSQERVASPPGGEKIPNFDKFLHFLEYLILGLLLAFAVDVYSLFQTGFRIEKLNTTTNAIAFSAIVCILYGMSDEIHQYFVPGRSCDVLDLLVDSFGGIVAQPLFFAAKNKVSDYFRKN